MTDTDKTREQLEQELAELRGQLKIMNDSLARFECFEKALPDSGQQYWGLIQNMHEGVVVQNEKGIFVYVNNNICRKLGYAAEELIGRSAIDFVHEDSHKTLLGQMEFRRQNQGAEYEIILKRKDGGKFHSIASASPLIDPNGEYRGSFALITDISSRIGAEEALRESEERYRKVIENAGEGIMVTQGNRVTYINKKGEQITGYSFADLSEIEVRKLIHPDDYPLILERYVQPVTGVSESFSFRVRIYNPQGEIKLLEVNVVGITWENSPALLHIFSDITDRRRAEEDLRESESRYRSLIEISPDAINVTDISGRITMANQRSVNLFGFESRDDLIDRDIFDLIVPDDREKAILDARLIIAGGSVRNMEYRMIRQDGSGFYADFSATLICDRDDKPSGFLSVIRDITVRKSEEDELKKYRDRLEDLVSQRAAELKDINRGLKKEIFERGKIEHDLRESEGKYRLLVDNIPEVISLIDHEGKVLFVNAVGARDMQSEADKIIGRKLSDYFPAEYADHQMRSIRRSLDSGEELYEEFELKIRDEIRWYDTTIHPVKNDDDRYSSAMIIARDITSRKKADEILQASEEKYRALVEATDTGYVILDTLGNVVDANMEYLRLTGRRKMKDIRGKNISEWTAPQAMEKSREEFDKCIRQGYLRNVGLDYINLSGEIIPVEISARVVETEDDDRVLALCRDVSESWLVQKALRESEEFNRAIIEHSPLGVSIRNRNGLLLGYNKAWRDIWAIPDDDIEEYQKRTRHALQFDEHDSYLGEWLPRVHDIYEHGGYLHIPEIQSRKHRTGKLRWLSQHFYAIKNDRDEVERVIILTEDISDHKQAEAELRDTEVKFRELADLLPQTLFETDLEGYITLANNKGFETTGYSREDLERGFHLLDLFEPDDQELVRRKFEERLAGIAADEHEYNLVGKDGRKIPVLIYSAPILIDDRPAGLRGVMVDISDRKRADEALQASETLYSSTLNAMDDPIHVIDRDMRFTLFSKSYRDWCRDLGLGEIEAVGRKLMEVFPFLSDAVMEEYHRVFTDGEMSRTEEITFLNEKKVITETRKIPVVKNGQVTHVITVLRDITEKRKADEELKKHRDHLEELVRERAAELSVTNIKLTREIVERRRTEEQLRESEERYRILFESAAEGILIAAIDDLTLLYANAAFCRLLGYAIEELMQMTISDIHPAGEMDNLVIDFYALAKGEKYISENIPCLRKDGTIVYVDISGTAAKINGRECNLGYFRDVTDRHRAQQALQESEGRFRMLSEATSEGIITHQNGRIVDFNQTATIMFGYGAEELPKINLIDLVEPEYAEFIGRNPHQDGEIAWQGMARRKDGSGFPIEVIGKACQYQGQTVRILAFRDLTEHKRVENELIKAGEELRAEQEALEAKNIALREVLGQIEAEKNGIKQQISANIEKIIVPSLKRFKETCSEQQKKHIDSIESSLETIASPFMDKLRTSHSRLSPRELEICQMIKNGLRSKEISEILNVSILTVHKHREIIRRKLGIRNANINLSSYLQSL